SKDVISKIGDLHLRLVEDYMGMRTLILTGKDARSTPHSTMRGQVRERVEALRFLVSDNPVQLSRIQSLSRESDALFEWFATQERLVETGPREHAIDRLEEGASDLEAARTSIQRILSEEERLDRERTEALRRSGQNQLAILLCGGAVIVVSTFLF